VFTQERDLQVTLSVSGARQRPRLPAGGADEPRKTASGERPRLPFVGREPLVRRRFPEPQSEGNPVCGARSMTAKFPGTSTGGRPVGTSFGFSPNHGIQSLCWKTQLRNPMASSLGRPMTGAVQDGAARPMTAVRAAGYSSTMARGSTFDPLGQSKGAAPPLESRNDDTPEEKIKILEKKVNDLIEESCMAQSRGDMQLALDKAKEAGRKERALVRQREQTGTADHINLDLTYSVSHPQPPLPGGVDTKDVCRCAECQRSPFPPQVLFNLATQYANNDMFPEALNTYQVIVKNKMFSNAGRLKVNMGNIYFKQKNYPKAIKFYRMALDQISNAHKEMRIKIMQNIGVVFIRMGQYSDAITSFEHIMSESPNIRTGFNLILCYYAVGDRDKMKKAFQKLISVPLGIDDEEKYIPPNDDPHTNLVLEAIKNDQLHQMERERKALAEKFIMTSAKLIAPAIESSFAAGFDWCVEMVKSSPYVELANDLEINKAITYLRQRDFNQAVETLKMFEKKDSRVKSAASTNLSFLYFLEKDYEQADRYADLAMMADRYNPAALVNKGNTLWVRGDHEKAAEFYKEALRNDASCTEGLYNLGTAPRSCTSWPACILYPGCLAVSRTRTCTHLPSCRALTEGARRYEMLEDPTQAIEWLMQLISVTPTDPRVLAKLGELYDSEGDKSQAFQYYCECYNWGVERGWGGVGVCDACLTAEGAPVVQVLPLQHRGNYQKALDTYKDIHRKFPENIECLRFLVRLCTDMDLKEVQDYATKLKKVEKMKEMREQRVKSGREGSSRSRRDGSASSDFAAQLAGATCGFIRLAEPGCGTISLVVRYPDSGQSSHGTSAKGERLSAKLRGTMCYSDASYVDPLGPQLERPKTAARKRNEDDEFADEELGDDLLPE
ncbi:intraflagellar transport protein 88-like, partial [Scleropages formosus]